MRQALLLLWITVLGVSACERSGTYHCDAKDDCPSADRCELTGLCSRPDPTCEGSGYRYDTSAGDAAGTCVTVEPGAIDASVAPIDAMDVPTHRNACAEGLPIPAAGNTCAAQVCAVDATCCSTQWSRRCVALTERLCDRRCSEVSVFGTGKGILGWDPERGASGSVFDNDDPDSDDHTDPASAAVAIADFDNDGDPDIAIGDSTGWVALRNDSTSTTPDFVVVGKARFTGADPFRGYHVAWADWDNDHDLDFAVSGLGGMYLVRNDGGTFVPQSVTPLIPNTVKMFDWGDIDGDGKLDLVVGNNGDGRIFMNDGTGPFREVSWAGLATEGIQLCDITGDSKPDVVAATDGKMLVHVNHDGVISPSGATVATAADSTSFSKLACADLDNDGDLDVALENWGPTKMMLVFRNKGLKEGLETVPLELTQGNSPNGLDFGDLDGDHKQDLVVSDFDGAMWWFTNTTTTGAISFRAIGPLNGIGGFDVDVGPALTRDATLAPAAP